MSLFGEVTLLSVATPALVAAMTRSGVRRLICISALGVGDSRGHGGLLLVDIPRRRIGSDSPLASALLGAHVGDTVVWHRPAGDVRVRVVSIAYD